MELKEHKKEMFQDVEIFSDVTGENLSKRIYLRVYAVNQIFKEVNFSKCVFEKCYFRKCKFIRCDFTGTEFKSSNFRSAQFDGCKFIYSTWEKTFLEDEFLKNCLPSEENLARDLVRELRVNYLQIGNYPMVNYASSLEVKLEGIHLFKAGYSKESYYRSKYKGLNRVKKQIAYIKWKILDLLWGNGESLLKTLITLFVLILSCSIFNWSVDSNQNSWLEHFKNSTFLFWGMTPIINISSIMSLCLIIGRFILIGLFMAILIKRLARR